MTPVFTFLAIAIILGFGFAYGIHQLKKFFHKPRLTSGEEENIDVEIPINKT